MKQSVKQELSVSLEFEQFRQQIIAFYGQYKFVNVVNIYEKICNEKSFLLEVMSNFKVWDDVFFRVYISYIKLLKYEQARNVMVRYREIRRLLVIVYTHACNEPNLEEYLKQISDAIQTFKVIKFFNNIAYSYYKEKDYDKALINYELALKYSAEISPDEKLQLLIGKAQSMYYKFENSKKKNFQEFFNSIQEIIKEVFNYDGNCDILLALAKLYYFIGDYDSSLNYLDLALKQNEKEKSELLEIYAYDWLSRIAYKQKRYSIAVGFYEKLIQLLTVYSSNEEFNIINPLPRIHNILQYLNETKELVAKQDISYINKTIWAGIVITALFGLIEFYRAGMSLFYIFLILLATFIIVFAIIHLNVKFVDWFNKHCPTFSKIFKNIFKKLT